MDTAVGLTRDRTSNGINDTDAKRTPLQAIPHSQDGIGRLSTLTQEHANVVSEDGSLPIQEITRQFNGDGNLREFFEDGTGRYAGVVRGSACAEDDATTTANDGKVGFETTESDPARTSVELERQGKAVLVGIEVDTPSHRINHALRLFVDFLLHEVIKLALHNLRQFNLQGLDDSLLFTSTTGGSFFSGAQTRKSEYQNKSRGDERETYR
jgi:hypothetical protein